MTSETEPRNYDKEARNKRDRLSRVRVLLADRDNRTATLVHRILFSFGFRQIDLVTSGEDALEYLRRNPYDLIITEWQMAPISGLELVKAIRQARDDNRIRRDIPILMLTAFADKDRVEAARDAGINEFILKPFSAKTVSNRIMQVIDNPRAFVEAPGYVGPCRRRREAIPEGISDRRIPPELRRVIDKENRVTVTPPDHSLRDQLGTMQELLTPEVVAAADAAMQMRTPEVIAWARDDIGALQSSYAQLQSSPADTAALQALQAAARSIVAQAEQMGYALGARIGAMLVAYLQAHAAIAPQQLTVIGKHIDAVAVIFTQQIRDHAPAVGEELVVSLQKLIVKLG